MEANHALSNSLLMTATSKSLTQHLLFGKEIIKLSLAGSTLLSPKKVLSTIYRLETSRQVWTALANQFANQSKSRIANLKKQLQSLHQGPKSCTEYLQAAKECADQLAAVGKPIPDDDLITYLSNGLNSSYNSFITTISILSQDKQLTFEDFQEKLLNHEMLLNHQQTKVADTSTFALFNQRQGPRNFAPRPHGGSF